MSLGSISRSCVSLDSTFKVKANSFKMNQLFRVGIFCSFFCALVCGYPAENKPATLPPPVEHKPFTFNPPTEGPVVNKYGVRLYQSDNENHELYLGGVPTMPPFPPGKEPSKNFGGAVNYVFHFG